MTSLLPADAALWEAVDDGVMGGRSSSRMSHCAAGLCFEGSVSLANGGGFASVRAALGADLDGARGLALEVRGDGRRYQLRLRADARSDRVAWRYVFTSTPDWQTLELPLEVFEPVFRGRRVTDAGPLCPGRIGLIGFMTAERTPGPFRLEIATCQRVNSLA